MARLIKEKYNRKRFLNEEMQNLYDTIDALEAEIAAWKDAIYGITPGGSEFVDDPKACAEYFRERTNYPRMIINLRAEIAALKQPMACGHPKTCLTEKFKGMSDGYAVNKQVCTACLHERLEVTAAIIRAAKRLDILGLASARDEVLALTSPEDASLLDAHEEELRIKFSKQCEEFHEIGHQCRTCGNRSKEAIEAEVQENVDAAVLAESEWWYEATDGWHERIAANRSKVQPRVCWKCNGTGHADNAQFTCSECHGDKVQPQTSAHKTEGE